MMDVYEAWTKADGVIIATPTHECNVSSHLKIMLDRLISLDGGAPFDPPPGWSKTAERAKAAEEQMKKNGLQYNPRLRKKAVTAIVFGHETGAQLAASAIMSSCHNRGMYNPPFGMVIYHLGGSGSPMIDPSTYSYSDGGKEIQEHIRAMVSNLVTYAKRDRELEVDFPDQNRT